MNKRFLVIIAILLCISILPGCGNKKKGNVFTIGTEATFPPFESTDDDDNIVGLDIDIIKYIADDNKWDINVVHLPFDSLIASLQTDKLDIVIAAMTITSDRAQKVLFSDPYFDASQVIVIRQNETRRFSFNDIVPMNLLVAVQMGTTGAFEGEDIFGSEDHPNLKQYKRVNEAFMDLKNGRVDLVIIDEPVAKNYMAHLGGLKILGTPFTNEQYGIAVKKNNSDLMGKINKSLNKLMDSKEYENILEKWFGE